MRFFFFACVCVCVCWGGVDLQGLMTGCLDSIGALGGELIRWNLREFDCEDV